VAIITGDWLPRRSRQGEIAMSSTLSGAAQMAPGHTAVTAGQATAPAERMVPPSPGTMQFGIMVYPDAPPAVLAERYRRAEALGFDQLFLPDHSGDLRNLDGFWLEGWTALTAAALQTSRIRIGPLVSNPILRSPAMLAKQALAVDHLSGGRLELGIGAGIFDFDHHAVGTAPWSARERAGRFAEYVEIVDGVLRGAGRPYTFEGQWLWARDVPTAPGPVQQPRPPLIVGGQSPTILRVAAERADVWNTIGPMGAAFEEVLEATARQNRQLDELCTAAGRDPSTLRRSLAVFQSTDPWVSPVTLEEVVERFTQIGIAEFVIGWPEDEHRVDELEPLALNVIPTLRRG
jgi:alkanesulfonate monooxygenase SsuD/methylene tetrahydromethanopterin reductase-like flavin-dependent oxidoreductase (luciferase family)